MWCNNQLCSVVRQATILPLPQALIIVVKFTQYSSCFMLSLFIKFSHCVSVTKSLLKRWNVNLG